MAIRIFVDKNAKSITESLVQSAELFTKISGLPDMVLGDNRVWEVAIVDSSTSVNSYAAESSNAAYNIKIAIGVLGNPNPATFQDTWTFVDINFRSAKLDMAVDGVADLLAGAAEKAAVFEVEIITPDGDHNTICQFPIKIRNQVIPGAPIHTGTVDEAFPIADSDYYYPKFLPLVTGLVGGGSTNLDGVITAGGIVRPKSFRRFITTEFTNGKLNEFQFWPATGLAPDDVDIIAPDDFNASTNNYYWIRRA
ncbi:MAG: hypothetical protein B9S32_13840 [Verrucomicrobia bacterium Tous-C9LFEB]|nr:MAG: hypothetical protein B9S32_13840 [Verrucomicrobia bacterium Tous-C9LFEB]